MTRQSGPVRAFELGRPDKRAEFLTFVALAFGVWPLSPLPLLAGMAFWFGCSNWRSVRPVLLRHRTEGRDHDPRCSSEETCSTAMAVHYVRKVRNCERVSGIAASIAP